jgi:hypothetical protein
LFDLLEPEQRLDNLTGELRFDIDLLAGRLVEVIDWVGRDADLRSLRIGLFGASTGAAAALLAAAARGRGARGGQPGRANRPGGTGTGASPGADLADRRRTGPGGARIE